MLNLWNPEHLSIAVGLIMAFLLGMIHGVTPDEHTWPITFSYSVGSYSTKGGMQAGFWFSAGFTLQRAIGSELAFFALSSFLMHPSAENTIYVIVGSVMALSGYYILHRNRAIHLIPWLEKWWPAAGNPEGGVPLKLAFVHGIVAGWGTGAFATILYTVISPSMPSMWIGFLPGVLFGLGTLVMQVVIGAMFGWWMQRRQLDTSSKLFVGRLVSGNTLLYGGVLFVAAGLIGLLVPATTEWSIATGIHVHNLDSINLGLVLVILVVAGIGGVSMWRAMRLLTKTTPR